MDILEKIIKARKKRLAETKSRIPLSELEVVALKISRDGKERFEQAIKRQDQRMRVIAELKKASPSAGLLRQDFEPVSLAMELYKAGADALSILTEEDFFQGSAEFLKVVRDKFPEVPILRKDFIFDEYQLWEAKAWGADAVLLIVAILEGKKLKELLKKAEELDLAALVEVHSPEELQRALAAKAKIIGINNRNLKDFSVDINLTERLLKLIPDKGEGIIVSESGIKTRKDIEYLLDIEVDAVLIGEFFMRAKSPANALRQLIYQDK